jgi:hypothetical protein
MAPADAAVPRWMDFIAAADEAGNVAIPIMQTPLLPIDKHPWRSML